MKQFIPMRYIYRQEIVMHIINKIYNMSSINEMD